MFDATLARAETLATARHAVRALAFTGDGAGLLAAGGAGRKGALAGMRTADGHPVFALPLPAVPLAMASRGDGRSYALTGFASGNAVGSALAVSIAGDPAMATIAACDGPPRGLALGPDADRLYATCLEDRVVEVDLHLRRRVRTVPLTPDGGCGAGPPVLGGGGALLLVPCRRSGVILRVDRVTLRALEAVELGVGPINELAGGSSGVFVALAGGPPPVLVPLDPAARPLGSIIALPEGAVRLAATASASTIYVSGETKDGAWLARVEIDRGVVSRVAAIPRGHTAIAVWPDASPPVMWFAKSLGDKNNPGP